MKKHLDIPGAPDPEMERIREKMSTEADFAETAFEFNNVHK